MAQQLGAFGRGIRADRAAARRECTQVIDAVDVIGVAMREPHGIDVVDARTHELQSQLGRRIDQNARTPIGLDDGAVPRAAVARINRRAHAARTADDRDTEGGSRTEEAELHSSSTRR